MLLKSGIACGKWNDSHLEYIRIIVKEKETILGCPAPKPVSGRCVYGGVAEVSVYVSDNTSGKGIIHSFTAYELL